MRVHSVPIGPIGHDFWVQPHAIRLGTERFEPISTSLVNRPKRTEKAGMSTHTADRPAVVIVYFALNEAFAPGAVLCRCIALSVIEVGPQGPKVKGFGTVMWQ